jgi:hypothetical protein
MCIAAIRIALLIFRSLAVLVATITVMAGAAFIALIPQILRDETCNPRYTYSVIGFWCAMIVSIVTCLGLGLLTYRPFRQWKKRRSTHWKEILTSSQIREPDEEPFIS